MNDKNITASIYNLANVLENYEFRDNEGKSEHDLILETCQLVAKAQNLHISPLPKKLHSANQSIEVELLCDYSHIRFRKVKLGKNWWQHVNSPLVSYQTNQQGEKQLVALIQNKNRIYEIHNLYTNETKILTNANASTLANEGWVFYRSFLPDKLDIKNIFSFLSIDKRNIRNIILVSLAACLGSMVFSFAMGDIVDSIMPSGATYRLLWLGIFLFIMSIAVAGFSLTQNFIFAHIIYKIDALLVPAIWDRVLKLPISFFKQYQAGDLILRIYSIMHIRAMFTNLFKQIIMIGILFCYLGVIFFLSPFLFLIILVFIIIYLLITVSFAYVLTKNNYKIIKLEGNLSGIMLQYILGIHKIKTSYAITRAYKKWTEIFSKKERIFFKNQILEGVLASVNNFLPIVMTSIFFIYIFHTYSNNFKIGMFLIVLYLFQQSLGLITEISNSIIASIESIYPELQRIKPILETIPEVDKNKHYPDALSGKIEINQVHFSYKTGEQPIFSDISMQIKPGEYIGIAGESGSGKSTLLRLLLGFEKPDLGSIYYDEHNLSDMDITAIRRQIGVVLQNGQLVAGTILQNIVGSLPYTIDDAWQAAKLCGLDKDIAAMPMGMHTWICEGASTLSGGQRQLLLIARALISKPKIIFFDEATSVLDNNIQSLVIENILKLKVTRIVIAHRISTLEKTDKIFVLKKGRIVEEGSYQELIAQQGYFWELTKRQKIQ